jgi:hypothetical protein
MQVISSGGAQLSRGLGWLDVQLETAGVLPELREPPPRSELETQEFTQVPILVLLSCVVSLFSFLSRSSAAPGDVSIVSIR